MQKATKKTHNEKFNTFKKNKITILVFLIIIIFYLIVYREWIFNISDLTDNDWMYYTNPTMQSIQYNFFHIWIGDYTMGRVLLEMGQAPVYILYGLFSKYLNFNYALIERIVFFWPVIVITPISAYLFIQKLFKNKIASVIGMLVYSFNTYFLVLETGHITLMAASAFSPLILYFYLYSLEKMNLTYVFLCTIFLFISSAYEPRVFYLYFWLLIFYGTFYVFFIRNKKEQKILKTFIYLVLPLFLSILLNLFWIISLSQSSYLYNNNLFSRILFGNEFENVLYAFTLEHPFWNGSLMIPFIVQPIPLISWIIPLTAILGLMLKRKNMYVLFFGFVSLLGILLTKQVNIPFTNLYQFLYDHFPGFNAYRESSKFYYFIVIGYTVLISAFISWMFENWKQKIPQVFGRYILTIFIALVLLWNTKPLITGEIRTLFMPKHLPIDYIVLNNYIYQQNDFFRTLWLPTFSRWGGYTLTHPELSGALMIDNDWLALTQNVRTPNTSEGEIMMRFLTEPQNSNLLSDSSIKYIVLPLEDNANDDNFFPLYGEPRSYYLRILQKMPNLKRVNIGTKDVILFENTNFHPHFYTTNQEESRSKNFPYKKVNSYTQSPTEYTIVLNNINRPVFLNFSENYNPHWRIRVGEFSWLQSLTTSNYFLPKKYLYMNNAFQQSYFIDPELLCKSYQCESNPDGTYTLHMTLFFEPQAYVYIGGIVSILTGAFIVGYLLFKGFLKLYEKK